MLLCQVTVSHLASRWNNPTWGKWCGAKVYWAGWQWLEHADGDLWAAGGDPHIFERPLDVMENQIGTPKKVAVVFVVRSWKYSNQRMVVVPNGVAMVHWSYCTWPGQPISCKIQGIEEQRCWWFIARFAMPIAATLGILLHHDCCRKAIVGLLHISVSTCDLCYWQCGICNGDGEIVVEMWSTGRAGYFSITNWQGQVAERCPMVRGWAKHGKNGLTLCHFTAFRKNKQSCEAFCGTFCLCKFAWWVGHWRPNSVFAKDEDWLEAAAEVRRIGWYSIWELVWRFEVDVGHAHKVVDDLFGSGEVSERSCWSTSNPAGHARSRTGLQGDWRYPPKTSCVGKVSTKWASIWCMHSANSQSVQRSWCKKCQAWCEYQQGDLP